MKIEIEITEGEIRDAIERSVRFEITTQMNSHGFDVFVRDAVKKTLPGVVDKLISEYLENYDALKNMVIEKIVKTMTARIQAALKMKN